VPSDDAAVFLERVRRPAALLNRDPLGGKVTERTRGHSGDAVLELNTPAVALGLGIPLASRLHYPGAVFLLAGQRVPAEVRAQLPHAWPALSHAACHGARVGRDGIGWDSGWDEPKTSEAPESLRGF
jgi:hypothetical protein